MQEASPGLCRVYTAQVVPSTEPTFNTQHCSAPMHTPWPLSASTIIVNLGKDAGFILFWFWYYELNLGSQAC